MKIVCLHYLAIINTSECTKYVLQIDVVVRISMTDITLKNSFVQRLTVSLFKISYILTQASLFVFFSFYEAKQSYGEH